MREETEDKSLYSWSVLPDFLKAGSSMHKIKKDNAAEPEKIAWSFVCQITCSSQLAHTPVCNMQGK